FVRSSHCDSFPTRRSSDLDKGGNRGNIKFALPATYDYLLQYHALSGDQEALRAVTVILDRMAAGGIYDQVGGGFARYSTDPDWLDRKSTRLNSSHVKISYA